MTRCLYLIPLFFTFNSWAVQFSYDSLGRLTKFQHNNALAETLFLYDVNNNIENVETTFRDSDGDSLSDLREMGMCTDPYNPDSDGDGLIDGLEVSVPQGPPPTDPCSWDSDGDGIDDYYEYHTGLCGVCVDDQRDSDGDGKSNWQNYVEVINQQIQQNLGEIRVEERLLDLADNDGFLHTGILPHGQKSMMLMYWAKHNEPVLQTQFSGVDDGQNHKFILGVDTEFYPFIKISIGDREGFPLVPEHSSGDIERFNERLKSWTHYALSYDAENQRAELFINGKRDTESILHGLKFDGQSNIRLLVGALHTTKGAQFFQNALIEDVQIWSRTLTNQEIERYMNKPPVGDEEALLAYYDFSKTHGEWVENVATGKFDARLTDSELLSISLEKTSDQDGDGLSDWEELTGCSDPRIADTDKDGLSDGKELGVLTGEKIGNPCLADSDSDGMDDLFEYTNGFNILLADGHIDTDQNGRTNWQDYADYVNQQAELKGEKIVERKRLLSLLESRGFMNIGIVPQGDQSVTFTYSIAVKQGFYPNVSGVDAGFDRRFTLGKNYHSDFSTVGNAKVNSPLDEHRWISHLTLAYDAPSKLLSLYVNGKLVDTAPVSNFKNDNQHSIWIGAVNAQGTPHYSGGEITSVQIWNRALSESEVGSYVWHPPVGSDEGLIAYYDFSRTRGLWVENIVTGKFEGRLSESGLLTTPIWLDPPRG